MGSQPCGIKNRVREAHLPQNRLVIFAPAAQSKYFDWGTSVFIELAEKIGCFISLWNRYIYLQCNCKGLQLQKSNIVNYKVVSCLQCHRFLQPKLRWLIKIHPFRNIRNLSLISTVSTYWNNCCYLLDSHSWGVFPLLNKTLPLFFIFY